MYELLVALYAVADSGLWNIATLTTWADSQIVRVERPSAWLLDLSLCGSREEAQSRLGKALEDTGTVLPDDYGDLLAGCTLLRFERTAATKQDLVRSLFDVCDAYSITGLDVSQLGELAGVDPETLERAWAELKSAIEPLVDSAIGVECQLRSESLGKAR